MIINKIEKLNPLCLTIIVIVMVFLGFQVFKETENFFKNSCDDFLDSNYNAKKYVFHFIRFLETLK